MSIAVAAILVLAGPVDPSLAQVRPKIIEVPPKKSTAKECKFEYPPRLDGSFTQVYTYKIPNLEDTHTTTGNVTWTLEEDSLAPLTSKAQPAGQIGSKEWRNLFAKSLCDVRSYRITAGELTVQTEHATSTPGWGCKGKGTVKYDAVAVLGAKSALYLSDYGYLLTLAAPDTSMGRDATTGECHAPVVGRYPMPPTEVQTNPNIIMILDRRGKYVYGVHGAIEKPIAVSPSQTITAKWDFADPAPNR